MHAKASEAEALKQIAAQEELIAGLNGQLSQAEVMIVEKNQAIDDLLGELEALKNELDPLHAEVKTLRVEAKAATATADAERKLNDLTQKYAQALEQIDDLKARNSALETEVAKIPALHAEIAALKAAAAAASTHHLHHHDAGHADHGTRPIASATHKHEAVKSVETPLNLKPSEVAKASGAQVDHAALGRNNTVFERANTVSEEPQVEKPAAAFDLESSANKSVETPTNLKPSEVIKKQQQQQQHGSAANTRLAMKRVSTIQEVCRTCIL